MRVLHVSSGNLYGGVETLLVTLARERNLAPAMQPEFALWLPFLAFVALIFWMYHVIAQRPGGQPIGALEAGSAKLVKTIRKLLPRRRFERVQAAA